MAVKQYNTTAVFAAACAGMAFFGVAMLSLGPILGKLGADLSLEQGYAAAREATINCLSAIKGAIGDLDKVERFVKVFGMVNSAPDFVEQPAVINGVSDLLIEAFGEEIGGHARSAVGMASLPRGIATEVEMILQVKD